MVAHTPIETAGRERLGDLIRAFDWAATPLGPIDEWPDRLRFSVELCLGSAPATAVYWGPELVTLYNDAFADLLGDAHPRSLGRSARQVWAPLWDWLGPQFAQVIETGAGLAVAERMVPVVRGGVEEETYWTYSLSPLFGSDGRVAGVLAQREDVTRAVLAERRLSFQVRLADLLRGQSDPLEIKRIATELLGEHLGAARVGYAEVDEATGLASVRRDWTSDSSVVSLAGQAASLEAFGGQAMAYLRAGQVMAIEDIRALGLASEKVTAAWEAVGVRALITVPLVREGALKALLFVHEPRPREWRRAEAAIARDVAERSWAAVERARAERSLVESEDHYRHTVELNPQVTWTALPDGQLNRVSSRWNDWTGTTGLGDSWAEGLHPDDRPATFAAWARSVETGEPYDIEHRVKRVDGSYRWARSRAFPRRGTDGAICLWYGSTEDIDERKAAEEHQRLLINELNHRVKNSLASVQAIAFQTLKGDLPLADARARFEERLIALSRAHNLLTEENWGGAALRRVIEDATEHLGGPARFDVSGEPLWLSPRAALALAMALHELGTNAAKYGALSAEAGRVSISWSLEEGRLRLYWRESGGPPVAEPARRGFGSRLIERGLEADLGGSARLRFEPGGLRCQIDVALDAVQGGEARHG
jgi:PAS domain S-box-containing protein